MEKIQIRSYKPDDYPKLRELYKKAGWFDDSVDSKNRVNTQIRKDPNSILVAVSGNKIVGTLTLLATGRLALFFRLVTEKDQPDIRGRLLKRGEKIFTRKGYSRLDIIAPEEDTARHKEYARGGFKKGNSYRWFWKNKRI